MMKRQCFWILCWVLVLMPSALVSTARAQNLLGGNPVLPQLHARALAWADYDLDGDVDLLMTGNDSAGVAVTRLLRNMAASSFVPVVVPFHAWPMAALAWGDLDGDGDPDLLQTGMASGPASSGGGKGAVALWRNNGVGGFASVPCGLPGVRSGGAAWSDLDGDGDPDVVFSGQNYDRGYVTVVGRNDGGVLREAPASLPGACCGEVVAADVCGDSLPDILLTGQDRGGDGLTRVLCNGGGWQFAALPGLLPDVYDGSLAVADLEGDGDRDIAAMGLGMPMSLGLWRNDTSAGYVGASPFGGDMTRGDLRWADFDGDGLMDLLVGGMDAGGTSTVRALRQWPVGVFADVQPGSPLPGLLEPRIAVADWSGDGHLDFVLSGIGSGGVLVAQLYKWNVNNQRFEP